MTIATTPEDRATRYQRTAARLRREAEALGRRQERAELLAIAEQYERLAQRVAGACLKPPRRETRQSPPRETVVR